MTIACKDPLPSMILTLWLTLSAEHWLKDSFVADFKRSLMLSFDKTGCLQRLTSSEIRQTPKRLSSVNNHLDPNTWSNSTEVPNKIGGNRAAA